MDATIVAHSSDGNLLALKWDNWRLALLATIVGLPAAALLLPNSIAVVVVSILIALLVITAVVYSWTRHVGGLLVAPAIAVLVVMNIFPLLWSLGLSFYNYRADRQTLRFLGLRNYDRLL